MNRRVIVHKHVTVCEEVEIDNCMWGGCPAFSGSAWSDNDGEHGSGVCMHLYSQNKDYQLDVPFDIPDHCPLNRPDIGMSYGSWRSNIGTIYATLEA